MTRKTDKTYETWDGRNWIPVNPLNLPPGMHTIRVRNREPTKYKTTVREMKADKKRTK